MRWILVFCMIFLISFASASNVTSTITGENVLIEIELSQGDEIIFSQDYSLVKDEGSKVTLTSNDFVRKDGEYIFVMPKIIENDYNLKVILPQGFILSNDLVYPKNYEITSNGQSVILQWDELNDEAIIFYTQAQTQVSWIWPTLAFLILAIASYIVLKKRYESKLNEMSKEIEETKESSNNDSITKNLFGEEKRIVEFLIEKKSCWMKEIVKELNISKVMATRKVRSLVEKGILKKENFGRENKISLVKK